MYLREITATEVKTTKIERNTTSQRLETFMWTFEPRLLLCGRSQNANAGGAGSYLCGNILTEEIILE
jgi:hypothetical protein